MILNYCPKMPNEENEWYIYIQIALSWPGTVIGCPTISSTTTFLSAWWVFRKSFFSSRDGFCWTPDDIDSKTLSKIFALFVYLKCLSFLKILKNICTICLFSPPINRAQEDLGINPCEQPLRTPGDDLAWLILIAGTFAQKLTLEIFAKNTVRHLHMSPFHMLIDVDLQRNSDYVF